MKLFLFFLIVFIQTILFAQTQVNLDGKEYHFKNNKWYLQDTREYEVVDTIVTVKLKPGESLNSISNILSTAGITIENSNILGFIDLKLPQNLKFQAGYNHLKNLNKFEHISLASKPIYYGTPNDPYFQFQWYLDHATNPHINACEAWEFENGSTNPVTVAVIDASRNDHVDKGPLAASEWNFIDQNDDPEDLNNWHGNAVYGIFNAHTNNGDGIAGIAGGWEKARVQKLWD